MKALIFIATFFISLTTWGQDVKFVASIDRNPVATGDRLKLTFTLHNATPDEVRPPSFHDSFRVSGPSTSVRQNYVNGNFSSSYSYVYYIVPTKEGEFIIGKAAAKVKGKTYESEPIKIKITKGKSVPQEQQSQQKSSNNNVLIAKTLLSKKKVHQGEQLIATYVVYSRYQNIQLVNYEFPTHNGFWAEEVNLGDQLSWEREYEYINGVAYYKLIMRKEVLFPQHHGEIEIGPFEFEALVGGSFFRQGTRMVAKSNNITVNVQPLPSGKPENFIGTFDKCALNVSVDKTDVQSNEAITLSVKVNGSGNMKLVEELPLEFPSDFEVYDPKVKDKISVKGSGVSGSRTFEYLVVPRHAGTFEIAPVSISYFDTKTETYKTLTSDPYTFNVAKGEQDDAEITYSDPIKKDVEVLEDDIRFIQTDDDHLTPKGETFFGSWVYYSGMLSPALCFMLFLLIRKRVRNAGKDEVKVKSKQATKVATKRLAEARGHIDAGERNAFYEAIFKAMYGYISDKLNIPVSELSKESITSMLANKQVSNESVQTLVEVLDECEMARFAPVTNMPEQQFYQKAGDIMNKIEEELR